MSPIDTYLAGLTSVQKEALDRIRQITKQAVPDTEDAIAYAMPAMKYKGKYLIQFAAFSNHMSIFGNVDFVEYRLKDFKQSKRGTVQFTEEKQIPEDILREIVLSRAKNIDNETAS